MASNYAQLGLKCGLEIHQQIEGKKLFCNCPTSIRDDQPTRTVKRLLRISASELGEIDAAAQHEAAKAKTFIYEIPDTTCLVELDEEPPHDVDQHALQFALQFSALVKAKIVDHVHFMRKTIVDGSNTSAFQRTALLARNGRIRVQGKTITIPTILLEEDAARIIATTKETTTYRLDRLGIPLIEIATGPDITSPEQCKAVAETIGMYLRSIPGVKRGLGTIRQDVNVSIRDGCRVEIKGAQDLKMLPSLVENEADRQKVMLELFTVLKAKHAAVHDVQDITPLFLQTQAKVIKTALDKQGKVLALKLSGFAGSLGKEVQPGRRLGTEYADHAKLMGAGGLFHSDELPKYGITQEEVDAIKRQLRCSADDGFILIADEQHIAERAIAAVKRRAALFGLQDEVRKANPDGTSSFLRPMPGGSRMYPETDIPSFVPPKKIVLPALLTVKAAAYEKNYSLGKDLAYAVADAGFPVDQLVQNYKNIKPAFLMELLYTLPKEFSARKETMPDGDVWTLAFVENVLRLIDAGTLPAEKESVIDALLKSCKGTALAFETIDDETLKKDIAAIAKEHPEVSTQALMGLIMQKYRGKVSGKKIMDFLERLK